MGEKREDSLPRNKTTGREGCKTEITPPHTRRWVGNGERRVGGSLKSQLAALAKWQDSSLGCRVREEDGSRC